MQLSVWEVVSAVGGRLICGAGETVITGVKTDSREIERGDLFVPIRGERVDGHTFIDSVFQKGAAASFTENEDTPPREDGGVLIAVRNSVAALQALASYYRRQFPIPVIGVTGSVGKTTTKEMIALALSAGKNVMSTKGNFNSQIGLSLTLMKLRPQHQCAVIEMGVSEFGEMSRLAAVARPQIAVMTNIGVSHIAQFKNQNNILLEKLHITDGFTSNQVLLLCGDDPWLSAIAGKLPFPTVTYGLSEKCAFRAVNLISAGGGTAFDVLSPHGRVHVFLPAEGAHNVRNACAALAVSGMLGIPLSRAALKLSEYIPPAQRQQKHIVSGVLVIDDTYNASPDSMRSAIDVLASSSVPGKRIAVLGDMKELGDYSRTGHIQVGEYVAQKRISLLFTFGEEMKAAALAAQAGGVTVLSFDDAGSLCESLLSSVCPGDAVLVKGSRSMHMETIAERLLHR